MEGKKGISVIVAIYNEAHRIENFLRSFTWCDDLIVIDKSSTDGTAEIALRYTDKVITAPYSDTMDEARLGIEIAKNEWIMVLTASDIIHPRLVDKLLALINQEGFSPDVVAIPYALYVFGIRNRKYSPWNSTRKNLLTKKSALMMTNEVHKERTLVSNNIYRMETHDTENLYHLTHENLDTFFERHQRYTKLEADLYHEEKSALKGSLKEVFGALKFVLFKKKCYMLGFDGIALGLAYISYFIMKYLYVWEKFRGKGSTVYSGLCAEMLANTERRP